MPLNPEFTDLPASARIRKASGFFRTLEVAIGGQHRRHRHRHQRRDDDDETNIWLHSKNLEEIFLTALNLLFLQPKRNSQCSTATLSAELQ